MGRRTKSAAAKAAAAPPSRFANNSYFPSAEDLDSDGEGVAAAIAAVAAAEAAEAAEVDGVADVCDANDDDAEAPASPASCASGSRGGQRLPKWATEREVLNAELARVLHEEATVNKGLDEANAYLEEEESRANEAENAATSGERRLEGLQRRARELQLRETQAAEEEANWREMANAVEQMRTEDDALVGRTHAPRAEELEQLRAELDERRIVARERDVEGERQRRFAADERAMVLQAALDYVEGRLDIPVEKLHGLVGGDEYIPHQEVGVEIEAQRLLRKQRDAHREATRGLLSLCNKELRSRGERPKAVDGLLDGDGLRRLLSALVSEGLAVETPHAVPRGVAANPNKGRGVGGAPPRAGGAIGPDAERACRLKQALEIHHGVGRVGISGGA